MTEDKAAFEGKTAFITGASRGIGLAIAQRLARAGARIAIAAKTAEPHAYLEGTIHSAAAAIERAGGEALPLVVDVRFEDSVAAAVEATVERFGGIDICINNASAIDLRSTCDLPMKRFDLMHAINTRGTFLVTKMCLPHLRRAENPHVLMLSPPLDLQPRWFGPHVGYSIAKFGMSLCVLGMADEFAGDGIAVNALWPRTTIATAAIAHGPDALRTLGARNPEIMADAAFEILRRPSRACSGNFHIDDDVLLATGVRDFDRYRLDPAMPLQIDLFVDEAWPMPPGVAATIQAA
jgi:citronellol/citronellal dehydrogenase